MKIKCPVSTDKLLKVGSWFCICKLSKNIHVYIGEKMFFNCVKLSLLILLSLTSHVLAGKVTAPAAVPPLPSPQQLAWHEMDLTVFVHFGMNTFSGHAGTGTGKEDPELFNPTNLDCEQWVREAKAAGFHAFVLTAKHHDGFCLWPTESTDHSVASSTWRDGKGDVVRELSDACRKYGLKFGVYNSPWDRSANDYIEDPDAYAKLYMQQLRELLTQYGPIYEMWFDGNNASVRDWAQVTRLVRELQPDAIIKEGPRLRPVCADVRWVGNELATAKLANWNVFPEPGSDLIHAPVWFPVETDTPMVGHWFWADTRPLDLSYLMNYYYNSIGRGSIFLMNIAPNRDGVFDERTVKRLHEYADAIRKIYEPDYARLPGVKATADPVRGDDPAYGADNVLDGDPDTYWAADDGIAEATLIVDLGEPKEFNVVRLEEPIRLGQRIGRYKLDVWDEATGDWKTVNEEGYTIGRRKLDRIPRQLSSKIRLRILASRGCPLIQSIGVHLDEVSPASHFEPDFANDEVTKGENKRMPEQDPIATAEKP